MATCPKCFTRYDDSLNVCSVDGERLLPDEACQNFDAELQAGQLVGEYKVEKKIGEGAFGKVYAALHPVIGKRAAIKVLNREYSSNPSVVSRFVSEARAVNHIRHRNIIDIFSFGTLDGGLQYFLMELLDGVTFDAYIEQHGRLSPEEAIPIMRDIGRALDAAHVAGVAHRDLKPENVFLSFDEDGRCHPKLLDFGIAKLMGETDVQHHTRTGSAIGTPLYMSPEQIRGQGVDHRTDIYSFGVMMHEVLTGTRPFGGDSVMDLMFKHAKEPPPPMSTVCPAVPSALDGPVLQMLEKDAANRPQSLAEAVNALSVAANQAGFTVSMPTTKLSRSANLAAGLGSAATGLASAATEVHAEETVAAATGGAVGSSAGTMGAVESQIPVTKSSSTAIIVAAVAAVAIAVGVTVVMMQGGDAAPAADTPADSAATAEPQPEPSPAEPAVSAPPPEPEPSASTVASTSPAVPTPAGVPKPPAPVAKPPPATPAPTPAPAPKPKPPPGSDDIPNPFGD